MDSYKYVALHAFMVVYRSSQVDNAGKIDVKMGSNGVLADHL